MSQVPSDFSEREQNRACLEQSGREVSGRLPLPQTLYELTEHPWRICSAVFDLIVKPRIRLGKIVLAWYIDMQFL